VNQPYTCPSGVLTGNPDPCGWLPLIYPQYELPLALDNTAPAGRPFSFTINAMPAAPSGAPPIAGARVWVSYDDGAHWIAVPVSGGHGQFRVLVAHPARRHTSGAVSIRTEFWDTAGNRVEQTINRAYGLSSPTSRGTFE